MIVLNLTLKVCSQSHGNFKVLLLSTESPLGQASGIIVDTPSSFASGPSTNEYRQKLIKACVDAFKSLFQHFFGHI